MILNVPMVDAATYEVVLQLVVTQQSADDIQPKYEVVLQPVVIQQSADDVQPKKKIPKKLKNFLVNFLLFFTYFISPLSICLNVPCIIKKSAIRGKEL